jgi:hypothetical protein
MVATLNACKQPPGRALARLYLRLDASEWSLREVSSVAVEASGLGWAATSLCHLMETGFMGNSVGAVSRQR